MKVIIAGSTGFVGRHLLQQVMNGANVGPGGQDASLGSGSVNNTVTEVICIARTHHATPGGSESTNVALGKGTSVKLTYVYSNKLNSKSYEAFKNEIQSQLPQLFSSPGEKVGALVNLVGIKMVKKLNNQQDNDTNDFVAAHYYVTKNLIELSNQLAIPHFVHISVIAAHRDDALGTHTTSESNTTNFQQISHPHLDDHLIGPNTGGGLSSWFKFVPSTHSYHHTKWTSEQLIYINHQDCINNKTQWSYTIVRPSVIFGNGDDMITNLIRSLKHLPVFPLPGGGVATHQPIYVQDLAILIDKVIRTPHAYQNKIVEATGPVKMTTRQMIETVAKGTSLSLPILIPTPVPIVLFAANAMSTVLPDPLITPSQLRMLTEGMASTEDEARVQNHNNEKMMYYYGKTQLSTEMVDEMEGKVEPFLGISCRLIPTEQHYQWIESFSTAIQSSRLILFCYLIALFFISSPFASFLFSTEEGGNIWWRLFFVDLLFIPICAVSISKISPTHLKEMLQPSLLATISAIVFAIVCYFLSWNGMVTLQMLVPNADALFNEMANIKKTRDLVSPGLGFVLLSLVLIPAEELLWRGIVLFPACSYFCGATNKKANGLDEGASVKSRRRESGILASLASSVIWAASHLIVFNSWMVMVAAFTMGMMWSMYSLRTKSLYGTILTHLLWDLMTVYWFPLF